MEVISTDEPDVSTAPFTSTTTTTANRPPPLTMPGNSNPTPPLQRRLSSRRGSMAAADPYGVNSDSETARGTSSRITIVKPPTPAADAAKHERDVKRSSWGSTHSASSTGSGGRSGPGRLSFAFSTFTPINTPSSPGRTTVPGSAPAHATSFQRRDSIDRSYGGGTQQRLTPQQICDLATTSLNPQQSPAPDSALGIPTPFLSLPEEHYLPFLERPAEVTALLTSSPTSRLVTLLGQTFPPQLRASPFDPQNPPQSFPNDPTKWSFAELVSYMRTVDRDIASDKDWTAKIRTCILSRSELIWSRLKGALGVPPELEDDNEDEDDEELYTSEPQEPEAWLEPILPGDAPVLIASPIMASSDSIGFGREGGMESIGEDEEKEGDENADAKKAGEEPTQLIRGLRISTSVLEVQPQGRAAPSPVVPLRRVNSMAHNESSASRELGLAGPGRVRRSQQQERGTGDPLFPSSFAKLTMGPSLVANNPALRSGAHRTFRPGMMRRYPRSASVGDVDSNDFALSLGSESEGSFAGR